MNPLVSIITPCYNGEGFLDKYFASILEQTYDNLELIFVNDGSSDRTEEIALSYRAALEARGIIFKYLYQPNSGQAKAMNTGFREMTGKYLIWPDSDDLLSPDSVEKRVAFLEEHPKIAWARSNADAFNYDTGEYIFHFAREYDKSTKDIFMDLILEKTYCCCGCYMVRVSALKEIYPKLQIFESSQGQNWQILIPMAGRHICGYVDGDLYHCAVRANSHSRTKKTLAQEVDRCLGLKTILLNAIAASGRTDCDYTKIVDIKYQHILFNTYYRANDPEQMKACYQELKKNHAVRPDERSIYLAVWHPAQHKIYCTLQLLRRAAGKLKRMIIK